MPHIKAKNNYGIDEWHDYNGHLHREDGPAYIDSGSQNRQEWFIHGKCHREDGPSIIEGYYLSTGEFQINFRMWFINGEDLTHEIESWMKENSINYPFSDNDLVLFKLRWI